MAGGLNVAILLGTVNGDARLEQRNGSAIAVFKLDTVDKGLEGKVYPTQFVVILRGALAVAKAALCTHGKRILVQGTHEVGRIFNSSDGTAGRTNDFSATEVIDVEVDDLNQAFLFGNIGQDAQLKNETTDKPFATLSLATNLYMGKDAAGGSQQRTLWNKVNLNGGQATGLIKSLLKGTYIGILGQYRSSKPYTTAAGEQRTEIQFSARSVVFGGSAFKGNGGGAPVIGDGSDLFAGLGEVPTGATQQPAPAASEPAGASDDLFNNY